MFNDGLKLHDLVQDLIRKHDDFSPIDDATFNNVALELFDYQYNGIQGFKKFCDGRGRTPKTVTSYLEIPAVPTDVFKHVTLCAQPNPAHVFRTSGTTQGLRGEHYFSTLGTYRSAIAAPFKKFVNPDGATSAFVLAPNASDLPDSSLSWMLSELVDPIATYFVGVEKGELSFRWKALESALDSVTGPVLLLGTAFGFLSFLDATDRSWSLPQGSKIMETGGFKGRTREITREELYDMFFRRFAVTECVAEYSMTELSSQAYTNVVSDGVGWEESGFQTPPWAKVHLLDPITLEASEASRGLIRWFDLANVDSVCSVLTSDIGERKDNGFVLHGRASDAELRGCSLTIEEIMQ